MAHTVKEREKKVVHVFKMNDTRSGSHIELSDVHLDIEMQLTQIIFHHGKCAFQIIYNEFRVTEIVFELKFY